MYDLSIIVPTIRPDNWSKLYESIMKSFSGNFELILIGPGTCYRNWIGLYPNIKFISDWGSPNRCQQIGLINSNAKYCTFFADDCIFLKDKLDCAVELLKDKKYNTVVTTKYTEGNDIVQHDDYYRLIFAYPNAKYIDYNWWIFNSAIYNTEYIIELGGFDCRFNVPCLGHADLAARAQNDGADVIFYKESVCACGHYPDRTGDHGPIHDSQIDHDAPLYKQIYDLDNNRIYIDINNWKNSDPVWKGRFND